MPPTRVARRARAHTWRVRLSRRRTRFRTTARRWRDSLFSCFGVLLLALPGRLEKLVQDGPAIQVLVTQRGTEHELGMPLDAEHVARSAPADRLDHVVGNRDRFHIEPTPELVHR